MADAARQDYSGSSQEDDFAFATQLDDLSMANLEELLQRNRALQNEVRSTINSLVAKMDDAIATRDALEQQLKEGSTARLSTEVLDPSGQFSQILEAVTWKASYPYFLDSKDFPPPANRDDYIMKKNSFITISALKPCFRWTQSQMKILDRAVNNDALYKLQAGLKEKKAEFKRRLEEKLACQQMLQEFDMMNETFAEQLQEKLNSGRSIAELEEAIKETEDKIEEQAGAPLKKILYDPDHEHDWLKISEVEFGAYRSENEVKAMWRNCLQKSLSRKPWSEEETNKLSELAAQHNFKNWQNIAKEMGTRRSAYQAYVHFQTVKNKARNNWSFAEDEAVMKAVKKLRMGNYIPYNAIVAHVPGRNARQIAQRWRCHLDPTIYKGNFTTREDLLLIICRFMKKMSYGEISEKYVMRSTDQLRKRYFTLKSTDAFGEMVQDNQFYIDLDKSALSSLTSEKVKREISKAKSVSLKEHMKNQRAFERIARVAYEQRRVDDKNRKYFLAAEESADGKTLLKVQERITGGRHLKIATKEENDIDMFFFSKFYGVRKGRFKGITEQNAGPLAKTVQNYLEDLNARLDLNRELSEDCQLALVQEKLQCLTLESTPINSMLAPQYSTMVGYRGLLLEVAKLHGYTVSSPESLREFRLKCANASVFMNSKADKCAPRASKTCQNLHLVPSDSGKPTLTVHLHKDRCNGRICGSNEQVKTSGKKNDNLTICGNIQEFYFTEKDNLTPSLRLCLSRDDPGEKEDGIELFCDDRLPTQTVVDCDDSDHISPEEALDLWKQRFVALFSAPAILEMFIAPTVHDFKKPEQEEVPQKKKYYKKKRTANGKLRKSKEKLEKREEGKAEEKQKPPRKRRTAIEMREEYTKLKAERPTRTQGRPRTGPDTSRATVD